MSPLKHILTENPIIYSVIFILDFNVSANPVILIVGSNINGIPERADRDER